ncbi:hypothetical protein [Morganella psychrotolerans]|uniref:hypothetical protein n=1 Tax=Morganella psychrotolerans TaxID=368603 RepID=UPI0039B061EF
MKRKIINRVLIAIPILFLIKCSGVVDDILGSQFPLNVNSDGNSISIYINKIKDSNVVVEATYLTDKCTTVRLNAAYTEVSHSPVREIVIFDNLKLNDGIITSVVPISGGGWCNWELTRIYITIKPDGIKSSSSTPMVINVLDVDNDRVSYNAILAPIIVKYKNKNDECYYYMPEGDVNNISKNKNGTVYLNVDLKRELLTYTLIDEGIVIFPNGIKADYSGRSELFFPEFNTILKNSKLNGEVNKK